MSQTRIVTFDGQLVAWPLRRSVACLPLLPLSLLLSVSVSLNSTVQAADVPVVVETFEAHDESRHSGWLQSVNARDVTIRTVAGATVLVQRDRILSVRVSDLPEDHCPPLDASGWLLLTTGDQLRLQPLFIDEATRSCRRLNCHWNCAAVSRSAFLLNLFDKDATSRPFPIELSSLIWSRFAMAIESTESLWSF